MGVRRKGGHDDGAGKEAERAGVAAEQILVRESHEEVERLRAIVSVLSFEPLADGVESRDDALHVLGFSPGARPGLKALGVRFRRLASIPITRTAATATING